MKNITNLGFVVLLLAVLGCGCPALNGLSKKSESNSGSYASNDSSNTYTPTFPTKKGDYDLTMDKYNRIQTGTARSEVESILGGKGTEVSNTSGGGVNYTVNKWEGDDYKTIILTFKNNKVMTKSQVGLK